MDKKDRSRSSAGRRANGGARARTGKINGKPYGDSDREARGSARSIAQGRRGPHRYPNEGATVAGDRSRAEDPDGADTARRGAGEDRAAIRGKIFGADRRDLHS